MITSRLSVKSQTVLPRAVRAHLGVGPGDELVYELRRGEVVIRRRNAGVSEDPFVLFEEWAGEADEEAYGHL